MNTTALDIIFDRFQQTKHWLRLPNLQKGLMLKTFDESKASDKAAKEFYDFLEKTMSQKIKINIPLRK